MAKEHIVVVGAGVIGLTIANKFAEQGHPVTIVAQHFPIDELSSDYTSPWAGAHFRPFPNTKPWDAREAAYTRVTLRNFEKLVKTEAHSSVELCKGEEIIENPGPEYASCGKGYSEGIRNFVQLPSQPGTVRYEYDTWVLNSPKYLLYLFGKLKTRYHQRIEFYRSKLEAISEVYTMFKDVTTVINASGYGLQYDGSYDPDVYKIRGQTLLVKAPWPHPYKDRTVTRQQADGGWIFVIKRPADGGYILGGTKQLGADDMIEPLEKDTASLISRGKQFYPELVNPETGELDILFVNVGFRPARHGGSRVETEIISPNKTLIHAYGIGGMGYETSIGIAEHVFSLYNVKTKL